MIRGAGGIRCAALSGLRSGPPMGTVDGQQTCQIDERMKCSCRDDKRGLLEPWSEYVRLADLVDLELQLLRDQDLEDEVLRRRDRALGLELGENLDLSTVPGRHRLFRRWLARVRSGETQSAGERLERGLLLLRWTLVGLGLLMGAGTAKALLAYNGSVPINAVHFLGVLVLLQLFLFVLFLVGSTVRAQTQLFDQLGPLQRLFRRLSSAWGRVPQAVRAWLPSMDRADLEAMVGRQRSHGKVYGGVERWLLVSSSQGFGVAFNVGALVACLYLVTFSDLAFGWSSTLTLDTGDFHGFISALATPWAWVLPEGSPSLELVDQTRFFRLDSLARTSGVTVSDPALWGGWWLFLFVSVSFYGLLPRVVVWAYATIRARKMLRTLPLDHGELQSLFERLTIAYVDTRSPEERDAVEKGDPAKGLYVEGRAPAGAVETGSKVCTAVVWGGVPISDERLNQTLERRFGQTVRARLEAGDGDFAADEQACAALAADLANSESLVILLAESFEAPTKEVVEFVTALRSAVGPSRRVDVALVDQAQDGGWIAPEEDDLKGWQVTLQALGDPYLRVVSAVEGP